jgi:hypothetical protein
MDSIRARFSPSFRFRHAEFRFSAGELSAALLCAMLSILFGRQIAEQPITAVAVAGLGVLVYLLWRHPKYALAVAMAGLVLIEEFELSSTEAYYESGLSKSVLAIRFFGVSFMDALTLLVLLPVLIREWLRWREAGVWRRSPLDGFFVPLVVVYALGTVQGVFHALNFSYFSWEARDLLYIMAWFFIATRTLETKRDVVGLLLVIFGTFSAKSLLFIYRVVAGKGLFYGFDFYRPALGSDVPMMAVPLITLIALVVLAPEARRRVRVVALGLVAYWSVWFVGSLGRASYISATVALLVVFALLWKRMRWTQFLIPVAASLFGGLAYYFLILTEVNRELVGGMIGSSVNWVDAVTVYQDLSIGQRIMEIMNISETLTRAGAWLWGLGWGAPWAEIAVHHPIDVASFEYSEAVRGVHTSAHIDALYFLLKVGILGTLVIYLTYARLVWTAMRQFARERSIVIRIATVSLLVLILIIIPNYVYFIKLKVLLGVAVGCVSLLMARAQSDDDRGMDPAWLGPEEAR